MLTFHNHPQKKEKNYKTKMILIMTKILKILNRLTIFLITELYHNNYPKNKVMIFQ